MKYLLYITLALVLGSCSQSEEEKAAQSLEQINALYAEGKYRQTLDSISSLRTRFPKAIEARKKALKIWQDASLKMAQADVAATDVQLQKTLSDLHSETNNYRRNKLMVRRDSLNARYEAMCGVVRMIHMRQKNAE